MGVVGSFLEPLVVVTLLFGGAFFNRNKDYDHRHGKAGWVGDKIRKRSDDLGRKRISSESIISGDDWSSTSSTPTLALHEVPTLRRRKIQLFGYKRIVSTPNTLVFKDRTVSRVLQKFPFLTECWYWALVYWVWHFTYRPPLANVSLPG